MKRWSILGVSAIAGLALALAAGSAVAQSAKDLVGTWTIVSLSNNPYGPNPTGVLMFGANGRFSQTVMRSDLPKWASNNRNQGTPEEYKATALGALAFFGTYSVNGTDLVRHIEGSTYPNAAGTDQKLTNLAVTGDELKWTNPAPLAGGAPIVVVWKRAK
jgi:hypothetical protein